MKSYRMGQSINVVSVIILLSNSLLINGFFGGGFPSFPGIPNISPRGQLGDCYVVEGICNSAIIPIRDVPPYNRPLFSAIITPLIASDPSLITKDCDAMCSCLTGDGGSCERQILILNDNGCEFLRSKCRCRKSYGVIQQGQAAARLLTGRVCV